MAKTKVNDSTLTTLKITRVITYIVYVFSVIAVVFLTLGFVLQLFGANYSTPFVQFVYNGAYEFLRPFRGIFPGHQVSDTSYFNASALFAIVIYLILALSLHAFITYLVSKMTEHQAEIEEYSKN